MQMLVRMTQAAALLLLSLNGLAAETSDDLQLAKQLATELKTALNAALQGPPEAAIGVCNERAPQITRKIAQDNNVKIGRTALKVRNPSNAPTEWQRAVLLDFQNRVAAGEAIASIEYTTTVQVNGSTEKRYMKAIGVEPLCVTCHGVKIGPTLREAIRAKYPADAATGFNVGDLRGAVYVVRSGGPVNKRPEAVASKALTAATESKHPSQ